MPIFRGAKALLSAGVRTVSVTFLREKIVGFETSKLGPINGEEIRRKDLDWAFN